MTAPTFDPFTDIGSAWNGVYVYRVGAEGLALADEHKAMLDQFLQLDAIALTVSQTAEYAFANLAALKTAAPGLVAVAAQCAQFANQQYIDAMGGSRGRGIADALRRDSGEAADPRLPWPDPSEDPEPSSQFAPADQQEGENGG